MDSVSSIPKSMSVAFAVWVAAVAMVFVSLALYGSKQGPPVLPPSQWPTDSGLERSTEHPTLLVFIHPECPCSRATLDNLRDVATIPSLSIVLACVESEDLPSKQINEFASCRLKLHQWQARSNVSLVRDIHGQEANRFRAMTSGHCYLFDAHGGLMFSGGVTSSRGHQGASAGLASLQAALRGSPILEPYPVFGCPLRDTCASANSDAGPNQKRLLPATCKGGCRA